MTSSKREEANAQRLTNYNIVRTKHPRAFGFSTQTLGKNKRSYGVLSDAPNGIVLSSKCADMYEAWQTAAKSV